MNPAHLHNPKFTKHRFPRETTGATRRHLMTPLRLRLEIELPLKSPDRMRCRQTHRQSPLLGFLGSVPEVRALPSPGVTRLPRYYDPLRLPAGPPACLAWGPLPPAAAGPPTLPEIPFPRAVPNTPVNRAGAGVGCFPARAAFPGMKAGRRSPLHFRGLLRVHSRYGPPDRSTALGGLGHEASTGSVTQAHCSSATGLTDNYPGGTCLHWHLAPSWRTSCFVGGPPPMRNCPEKFLG